ncbi:DNA gyrase, B subunit [Halosimplex carlsbadense 2-9-1]|uniref:DNA gyrase, B subunit n=1 Tax=Halosimplex carlsbadense 2-9-1 TaxID=797114 RepID=M0D784_9EURY|nr:hypothetical protein [Halosimplex carlsbadense]ELZ30522.1 DNA gyrase, B subunit [Halosimplex carlsbadense 2-9-1]
MDSLRAAGQVPLDRRGGRPLARAVEVHVYQFLHPCAAQPPLYRVRYRGETYDAMSDAVESRKQFITDHGPEADWVDI